MDIDSQSIWMQWQMQKWKEIHHKFNLRLVAITSQKLSHENFNRYPMSTFLKYLVKLITHRDKDLFFYSNSGRVKESYPESDDESTSRIIRHAGQMIAERMSRKLSSSQGSLSRSRRHSQMGRQSRVMAGISVDRIIYSNRVSKWHINCFPTYNNTLSESKL